MTYIRATRSKVLLWVLSAVDYSPFLTSIKALFAYNLAILSVQGILFASPGRLFTQVAKLPCAGIVLSVPFSVLGLGQSSSLSIGPRIHNSHL